MASIGFSPPPGIKAAFQDYCTVLKRTGERHAHWNAVAREFIFRTLSVLSRELKSLRAVKEESPRNFDTVCLAFMSEPTNIVLSTGKATEGLVRFGGYLFYSQVFICKFLVCISYPYVQTLQNPSLNK